MNPYLIYGLVGLLSITATWLGYLILQSQKPIRRSHILPTKDYERVDPGLPILNQQSPIPHKETNRKTNSVSLNQLWKLPSQTTNNN